LLQKKLFVTKTNAKQKNRFKNPDKSTFIRNLFIISTSETSKNLKKFKKKRQNTFFYYRFIV